MPRTKDADTVPRLVRERLQETGKGSISRLSRMLLQSGTVRHEYEPTPEEEAYLDRDIYRAAKEVRETRMEVMAGECSEVFR